MVSLLIGKVYSKYWKAVTLFIYEYFSINGLIPWKYPNVIFVDIMLIDRKAMHRHQQSHKQQAYN